MSDGQEQQDALALPPADLALEKLFYSIGEVSDKTGVEPYVLRYWEAEFKPLHPSKRSSGQRTYQKKDIETILAIKKLLYEDLYTIAGARKKLREEKTHEAGKEHAMPPAAQASPALAVAADAAPEPERAPAPAPITIERIQKDEESLHLLREIRAELQALQEELLGPGIGA